MADTLDERESDFIIKKDSETVVFQPNHSLMARPRRRELDMQPQRLFFYKRMDNDQVVCFTEQEAAMQMKSSHRFILRQIGCSDGSTYAKSVKNCGVKPGQVITKELAQEILNKAFAAELEAAQGHYADPQDQSVHFDQSFPLNQRPSFQPPA